MRLMVPTVRNFMSSICTCFARANLPPLVWPELARRQVEAELVTRRRVGLEQRFIKPALMPSSMLAAESLQDTLTNWPPDTYLRLGLACIGLLWADFFGWRDDSMTPLTKSDLTCVDSVLHFSERFSKGSFRR